MSEFTHCDGPDCTATRGSREPHRLCTVPWIHVHQSSDDVDFCGDDCLVAWIAARPSRYRTNADYTIERSLCSDRTFKRPVSND